MLKTLSTLDGLLLTSVLTTFLMGENAVWGILGSGEQTRIPVSSGFQNPWLIHTIAHLTKHGLTQLKCIQTIPSTPCIFSNDLTSNNSPDLR
jgi:hypothetical protein